MPRIDLQKYRQERDRQSSQLALQLVLSESGISSELERLRHRIDELEELLGLRSPQRPLPGFTVLEWKLLGVMLKRQAVTREFAFRALYASRADTDQPKSSRIIDQIVHRIRVRLMAYGSFVETLSIGYHISPENKVRLRALIDEANCD